MSTKRHSLKSVLCSNNLVVFCVNVGDLLICIIYVDVLWVGDGDGDGDANGCVRIISLQKDSQTFMLHKDE